MHHTEPSSREHVNVVRSSRPSYCISGSRFTLGSEKLRSVFHPLSISAHCRGVWLSLCVWSPAGLCAVNYESISPAKCPPGRHQVLISTCAVPRWCLRLSAATEYRRRTDKSYDDFFISEVGRYDYAGDRCARTGQPVWRSWRHVPIKHSQCHS